MKRKNFVASAYRVWMAAAIILVICGRAPLAHCAGYLLVWPVTDVSSRVESNVALEPHELRKGKIALAPGIVPSAPSASAAARQAKSVASGGEAVTLSFFPDVTYQVTVDSQRHLPDGTETISARLENHRIGTVVVTIGPEGFLITLQDLNRGRLYRATGDSRSAEGTVTEIDMSKMPPVIR